MVVFGHKFWSYQVRSYWCQSVWVNRYYWKLPKINVRICVFENIMILNKTNRFWNDGECKVWKIKATWIDTLCNRRTVEISRRALYYLWTKLYSTQDIVWMIKIAWPKCIIWYSYLKSFGSNKNISCYPKIKNPGLTNFCCDLIKRIEAWNRLEWCW